MEIKKQKKMYTRYTGIGLIFGVALGYGFGNAFFGILNASIYAGIGAGLGIVTGSMIAYSKINSGKKK